MKLLLSYYLPSGGVETLHRLRAEALKQQGIQCHLHYQKPAAGLQNISGIPTYITNKDKELHRLVQKERYDAIFVSSDFFMLERIRNGAFKGPVIYEAQGLGEREHAVHTLTEAIPYLHKYSTAALYPDTSHLIELFRTMLPGLKQFKMANFLDTRQFRYKTNKRVSYPIIGWVGRIEKNKNWRDFLSIGFALRKRYPNLRLWMFEDADLYEPAEKAAFEQKLRTLGMESYVIRHSNIPHKQMPLMYSKIGDSGGFLLSTSILEGFGYAVSEAMSCRCPVLSTDSDGVRSFIVHDKTGKFYPIGQINTAVHHAIQLMENTALRERLRSQGEAHIHTNFNPDLFCVRFKKVLRELGLSL
ncbi:glycosyltransferase family 4 protein [Paenibacillus sp. TAB 01]|uniref:glycosyltransferase family 4 protein n=1 Tax=Paenibacillus sp. TAB 01 TaxID=3368988 RepID=UPI0037529A15